MLDNRYRKLKINALHPFIIMFPLILTACGTVSKEIRTVAPEKNRTLTVLATDPASNTSVSDYEIFSALTSSAYATSGYRREYNWYDNGTHTGGVSVKTEPGGLLTVYYIDNFDSLKKHKSGTFKVQISNLGSTKNISISCPSQIVDFDNFKTGIGSSNHWSDSKVAEDLSKICNGLKIAINRTKYVRGEINTPYPSDSVFANYARHLKPAEISIEKIKSYDIEKAKYFYIPEGTHTIESAISVFPYRSGSKVVYGIQYPYTLLGDGTTTYRALGVATIEKNLKAIAND